MSIEEVIENVKLNNKITINIENEILMAIELIKRQNAQDIFIEEKLINYALKKLFVELGLLNHTNEDSGLVFSSDHFNAYKQKYILLDIKSSIHSDVLFNHYYNWCLNNGIEPLTKQFFYREVCKIGVVKRRTNKGYKFNGMTIIQ